MGSDGYTTGGHTWVLRSIYTKHKLPLQIVKYSCVSVQGPLCNRGRIIIISMKVMKDKPEVLSFFCVVLECWNDALYQLKWLR